MQSQKHQENVPDGSWADRRDRRYHRKYIKLSHIGSYQYTGVKCRSYEWNGADLLYSDLADAGIYRICDAGRTSCRIFSGEESDEIKSAGSNQALENCCQREDRQRTRREEKRIRCSFM